MTVLWAVSVVALWLVVLLLCILVFILYRELGVRLLSTALAVSHDGLAVGESVPKLEFQGLSSGTVAIPNGHSALRTLVVFGSHRCPSCAALASHLNRFYEAHRTEIQVYYVVDETSEGARLTTAELGLEVPVLSHRTAIDQYKARVTPFAFVLDSAGRVLSKGLVNNQNHLDMLLSQSQRGTAAAQTKTSPFIHGTRRME